MHADYSLLGARDSFGLGSAGARDGPARVGVSLLAGGVSGWGESDMPTEDSSAAKLRMDALLSRARAKEALSREPRSS